MQTQRWRQFAIFLGLVCAMAGWPSCSRALAASPGGGGTQVLQTPATYWDFEQITVDNTAGGVTFTASKITPLGKPVMTYASCRVRTAEISYLYVPPTQITVTSSVGQLLEPGDTVTFLKREDIVNFRAIRTTSTSAQLDCTYKSLP